VLGGIGAAVVADATPVGYLVLTNAGTVAIKWAQTTADVSDAIVHIGSWLRFTKLA
jgi:predicted Zn-dependent protease